MSMKRREFLVGAAVLTIGFGIPQTRKTFIEIIWKPPWRGDGISDHFDDIPFVGWKAVLNGRKYAKFWPVPISEFKDEKWEQFALAEARKYFAAF